jgi:hypothetical protein
MACGNQPADLHQAALLVAVPARPRTRGRRGVLAVHGVLLPAGTAGPQSRPLSTATTALPARQGRAEGPTTPRAIGLPCRRPIRAARPVGRSPLTGRPQPADRDHRPHAVFLAPVRGRLDAPWSCPYGTWDTMPALLHARPPATPPRSAGCASSLLPGTRLPAGFSAPASSPQAGTALTSPKSPGGWAPQDGLHVAALVQHRRHRWAGRPAPPGCARVPPKSRDVWLMGVG